MRTFFWALFLSITNYSFGQLTISIEATPKLVFSSYDGQGVIPAGFFIRKSNPSLSLSGLLGYKFKNRLSLNIGISYNSNNYGARYYGETENAKQPISKKRTTISFYEPKAALIYSPSNPNFTNLYFSAGIGYAISGVPNVFLSNSFFVNTPDGTDTVLINTFISPLKNDIFQRIKLYFEIGKSKLILNSKCVIYLGLMGRLSVDESKINKLIIHSNKTNAFNYFLNSSFIGLNLRFSYNFKNTKSSLTTF